jgi:hypothetical protein
MSSNFFADWTSQADEEKKRRAWEALAGQSGEAPHRTLANQVQLPEVNVVADAPPRAPDPGMDFTQPGNEPPDFYRDAPPPAYDQTPPEPDQPPREADLTPGTFAQASPDLPPDAPPLAKLGASLKQRDGWQDVPSAPPAERDYQGTGNQTTWGGTALAALADILLNKGRGVGGVLALGMQGHSPMARAELDLKRAQAEHLRNPTSDPDAMAYKQAMLDLQREREKRITDQGGSRIELQRTNIDNTQNRFNTHRNDVIDPGSQFNQTQVAQAGARAGAGAQGRINAEHALNDVVAGDKSQVAGAEAAARIGAGHDLAPVTTADEANKAAAVIAAQTPPKLAYEQSLNPILSERSNTGMGQGLSAEALIKDNPGLEFSDPEQLQRAMKTKTINAQTLDKLQASNRAREILDSMYKTIEDFQKGDKTPEAYYGANKQLESHAQEYAGMMGRISGSQTQEQVRSDAARVPSLLNPYALTGVKKLWDAADANIRGNLGTLGIRARAPSFGQQASSEGQPTDAQGTPGSAAIDATNPTPSASPKKGDYSNYSRDTSDPLPVTKQLPPVSRDIQNGAGRRMYTVTKPSGKVIQEELTDSDAAALAQMPGWKVR